MADVISSIGNLFLALGGFIVALFASFAIIAVLLRLYLGFELWCEREREPRSSDDQTGDLPHLPSFNHDGVFKP